MLLRSARRSLLTTFLLLALLVPGMTVAQATPESDYASTAAGDVGVLGGCDWTGCGTVINNTGRGFHVTLNWGSWEGENVKWVQPHSVYGIDQWVDVDGIYVGSNCSMRGWIIGNKPLPEYGYPFSWGPGWHKIWTNETAKVGYHGC